MFRKFTRCFSSSVDRIRNIGIIAHIDAGKTTTTERILFYSGHTRHIGGILSHPNDVDTGNTVMDFMEQEQERGITIQSAAITFNWNNHKINLIDTPGHADFTVEVQRSLRVLDGTVAILDAVHGVQAQTMKVWKQADEYHIPRIVFINKMDREGADFGKCLVGIQRKLHAAGQVVLGCQIPIFRPESECASGFHSIVDLINMEYLEWVPGHEGRKIEITSFDKAPLTGKERQLVINARSLLVETIADFDNDVMDHYLETEDTLNVKNDLLLNALRRLTIERKCTPVFCGSSFKNIGVQPLLDAICNLLPSPLDLPLANINTPDGSRHNLSRNTNDLVGLVFKVSNDPKKGSLAFTRVYYGEITDKSFLLNSRTGIKERISQLCQIYADDLNHVEKVTSGNICVIMGMKDVKTGDTILGWKSHQQPHSYLDPIRIPSPVFVRAVEPKSTQDEKPLILALEKLQNEDPSISFSVSDSGQLLVSGMGELHLEILLDRLQREYMLNCNTGPVWISYRETLKEAVTELRHSFHLSQMINGKLQQAFIETIIEKYESGTNISVDLSDLKSITAELHIASHLPREEILKSVTEGIKSGLSNGPLIGFPVSKVKVTAKSIRIDPSTSPTAISLCAAKAVSQALRQGLSPTMPSEELAKKSPCTLLEPMMDMKVEVPVEYVRSVVSDLTSNTQGHVERLVSANDGLDENGEHTIRLKHLFEKSDNEDEKTLKDRIQCIEASVPLSAMVGYAVKLRSMTKGHGQFEMQVSDYAQMNEDRVKKVLKEFRF